MKFNSDKQENILHSHNCSSVCETDPSCIERCTSICPDCGKQCSLSTGHYSSHRCTDGHRWTL